MPKTETKAIYFERINKVLLHIEKNLGEKMDLEMLAEIAHFSPFHFHKIMRAYLRESLGISETFRYVAQRLPSE